MRHLGLSCIVLMVFGGIALALQSPELQEKAAAAKEAAARNQQALRSYSWVTKTELSLKGEVKNTKIESCKYGPDGKVQKTELSEPPPPPEKPQGLTRPQDPRQDVRRDRHILGAVVRDGLQRQEEDAAEHHLAPTQQSPAQARTRGSRAKPLSCRSGRAEDYREPDYPYKYIFEVF